MATSLALVPTRTAAQLSFIKEVDRIFADEGDTLTDRLTPSWGTGDALSNVVVEDTIPTGTTYVAGYRDRR